MDAGKQSDQMLDKIAELIKERDQARTDLATERVAHRLTKKQLQEVVGMALT